MRTAVSVRVTTCFKTLTNNKNKLQPTQPSRADSWTGIRLDLLSWQRLNVKKNLLTLFLTLTLIVTLK